MTLKPCECGFYKFDRPHSNVGGGLCEYFEIRKRKAEYENITVRIKNGTYRKEAT